MTTTPRDQDGENRRARNILSLTLVCAINAGATALLFCLPLRVIPDLINAHNGGASIAAIGLSFVTVFGLLLLGLFDMWLSYFLQPKPQEGE